MTVKSRVGFAQQQSAGDSHPYNMELAQGFPSPSTPADNIFQADDPRTGGLGKVSLGVADGQGPTDLTYKGNQMAITNTGAGSHRMATLAAGGENAGNQVLFNKEPSHPGIVDIGKSGE